jgi:hypothetical protein
MGLLRDIMGTATLVAIVAAVPLVCHLCIHSLWKAVGCSILYYLSAPFMIWPPQVPTVAMVGVVLASLSLVLAWTRWRAATSWLIPAALLAWCVVVALERDDRWSLLLSLPALAPVPMMVGVFVAAFRRHWRAVRWGRFATFAVGTYSIWWWVTLYPTIIGWDPRVPPMLTAVDFVTLVAAALSTFFGQSRREWGAYGLGILAVLALVVLWVGRATEGSYSTSEGECSGQVHQIMLCVITHADTHDGDLPDSLAALSREYGTDFDKMLRCAAAEERGVPASEDGYEYAGADLRISDIKNPVQVPIVFDRAGNHGDPTRSVGFVDGSVSKLTESRFRALLRHAVLASAYPQVTVEELKAQEPWLAKEMAR